MTDDPWTISRVLRWCTRHFREKSIDSPRLDAELLIADALNIDRVRIYTEHDRPLDGTELAAIRRHVQRRSRREPVAYITGSRGFWKLDLAVDPRVLIPRPETERMIEILLERLGADSDACVVDVGTGSGAIALALKMELPGARIIASDCSADALEMARTNAERNQIEGVELLCTHLLEGLGEVRPDWIVSNPPYIATAEIDGLMADVAQFEPRLALDGGADGLKVIRALIDQAAQRLSRNGGLLMEVGATQGPAVRSLLDRDGRYTDISVHADYAQLDRVVEAHRR